MDVDYDMGFCCCFLCFGTTEKEFKSQWRLRRIFIIRKNFLDEGRLDISLKTVLLERNFNIPTSYLIIITVVRNYSLTFRVQNLVSNFTPTPLLQTGADHEANEQHYTTIYQGQVFRVL